MRRGGGALHGAGMHAGLRGVHTCVRGCAHVCRAVQTRRGVHTCRDTPLVPVHVPADPRVPIRGPHPRCCSCCKGQTGKGEFALPSSGPPQPGAAPPFPRPPGGTGGVGAGTGDLGSRRPCAAPGAGQGRAALPVPPPARSRTDSTGSTGALLRSPPPSPPPPRAGTARVRGATVSAGHPGTGTACGAARWGRGWGGFGPFPPALRCSPRPAAPELPPQCPALQHCTAPGPPRGGAEGAARRWGLPPPLSHAPTPPEL